MRKDIILTYDSDNDGQRSYEVIEQDFNECDKTTVATIKIVDTTVIFETESGYSSTYQTDSDKYDFAREIENEFMSVLEHIYGVGYYKNVDVSKIKQLEDDIWLYVVGVRASQTDYQKNEDDIIPEFNTGDSL